MKLKKFSIFLLTKHDSQEILRADVFEESFPVNVFDALVILLREYPLEDL
jgi:hypothetical protein